MRLSQTQQLFERVLLSWFGRWRVMRLEEFEGARPDVQSSWNHGAPHAVVARTTLGSNLLIKVRL